MKRLVILIGVAMFILGMVMAAQSASITIQPASQDTWIWDVENYSHGNSGELRANQSLIQLQYVLIAFDVSSIPAGSVVNSSNLGLYKYGGYSDSGLTLDTHQILGAWVESVTWSTQPAFSATVESSATIYGNGWYTWDLTSLVQKWVNGTEVNNGVAIFDHGSSYFQRFYSSDSTDASFWPYLDVTYNQVPIPGAIWLLGSGLLGLTGWRRFRKS